MQPPRLVQNASKNGACPETVKVVLTFRLLGGCSADCSSVVQAKPNLSKAHARNNVTGELLMNHGCRIHKAPTTKMGLALSGTAKASYSLRKLKYTSKRQIANHS